MTQKITRKRALELAQECIQDVMKDVYKEMRVGIIFRPEDTKARKDAKYAELAAALAYIENLARQQEMHL